MRSGFHESQANFFSSLVKSSIKNLFSPANATHSQQHDLARTLELSCAPYQAAFPNTPFRPLRSDQSLCSLRTELGQGSLNLAIVLLVGGCFAHLHRGFITWPWSCELWVACKRLKAESTFAKQKFTKNKFLLILKPLIKKWNARNNRSHMSWGQEQGTWKYPDVLRSRVFLSPLPQV